MILGERYNLVKKAQIYEKIFDNTSITSRKNSLMYNTQELGTSSAFSYCNWLSEFNIPESVEKIANTAFSNIVNLEKIQINKEPGSIAGSPWGVIKGERIVEWLKK